MSGFAVLGLGDDNKYHFSFLIKEDEDDKLQLGVSDIVSFPCEFDKDDKVYGGSAAFWLYFHGCKKGDIAFYDVEYKVWKTIPRPPLPQPQGLSFSKDKCTLRAAGMGFHGVDTMFIAISNYGEEEDRFQIYSFIDESWEDVAPPSPFYYIHDGPGVFAFKTSCCYWTTSAKPGVTYQDLEKDLGPGFGASEKDYYYHVIMAQR